MILPALDQPTDEDRWELIHRIRRLIAANESMFDGGSPTNVRTFYIDMIRIVKWTDRFSVYCVDVVDLMATPHMVVSTDCDFVTPLELRSYVWPSPGLIPHALAQLRRYMVLDDLAAS